LVGLFGGPVLKNGVGAGAEAGRQVERDESVERADQKGKSRSSPSSWKIEW
jgi:hypothetical protein